MKIVLKYSMKKAEDPVIASVIRETDIPINILHADVSQKGGEIFVSVNGSEDVVNEVVELFEEKGVEAERVHEGIKLYEEECLDCGACLSLCPTDALKLDDEDSVYLDEEECVYCRACIPVCPVNAISIKSF